MEDEMNLMSMFDSDSELNTGEDFNLDDYMGSPDNELEDDDEDTDTTLVGDKVIKPIEDKSPESVDGDDDDEGDDSDDEHSSNLYSSISNVLFEQGIIPSLESSENIKTAEDFVEVFKKEIDNQANSRLETYLANLDLEKIGNSRREQIALDSIDEDYLKDNLEAAKDIIFRDYLNQGLSEDRARKLVRKTVDLGTDLLIEDALESTASLREYERRSEEAEKVRYKQSLADQAVEQDRINDSIKATIYNSKPIIEGMITNKALQDRVYRNMTEVVAKDASTGELQNKFMQTRAANPVEFDTKMYYLYELTNGFTDLKGISKTVTSGAVKKLESVLRKSKFEDNGTPGYMQDSDSYSGFGSELVY
jgi:hypothetical protein